MNKSNIKISKWITIEKSLCNILTSNIYIFNFLRGNIFTLAKLEDIFFTIYNFKGSIRKNNSDISSMVPTLLINGLFCVFFIFVVLLENRITSHAHLTFRRVGITGVIHFRHIGKFKFSNRIYTSYISIIGIPFIRDKTSRSCLSLPISLPQINL